MISAIINSLRIGKFDHVIVSSPPLFCGLIGVFYKKILKADFWLDIRDIWPESALELGQIRNGFYYKIGKKIQKIIYKNSKGFIVAVPSFTNHFEKFSSKISDKPIVELMNGVSKNFFNIAKKRIIDDNIEANFSVIYAGNIGLAQGLETIIEAAKQIKSENIKIKIIGDGVCKTDLIKLAKDVNDKIVFVDAVSKLELVKLIKKSSVCLVPLRKIDLFKSAIPSKIFEYMACSKPIILGVSGEAQKIISKAKCGIHVEPENPSMLAKAILSYYVDREKCINDGKNGFEFVSKNFSKEILATRLINDLKSIE